MTRDGSEDGLLRGGLRAGAAPALPRRMTDGGRRSGRVAGCGEVIRGRVLTANASRVTPPPLALARRATTEEGSGGAGFPPKSRPRTHNVF